MVPRTALLWLHVLAGALWIGASAAFVLAALAQARGEQRDLVQRAAPRIGWFCVAAATVVLVSGALNFALAGLARGFTFSSTFDVILAAKIALFVAMCGALATAMREATLARTALGSGDNKALSAVVRRMMTSHGAVAILGALALMLGLWLAGT